jgi:hypothetical protein
VKARLRIKLRILRPKALKVAYLSLLKSERNVKKQKIWV